MCLCLLVTLGFFDDITIPKNNLQKDSEYFIFFKECIFILA